MGIELVEASDLFVDGDEVFVRTTRGPRRVHVIYRRTDDAFLDPEFFRPDSLLGVPGLMRAYARGQRRARQRARQRRRRRQGGLPVRARHDPLLPRRGAAARAGADLRVRARRRPRVRARAPRRAGGQGGRRGGRLRHADGPAVDAPPSATSSARRILAEPRSYIAQHRIELSTCPTWIAAERRARAAPRRPAAVHPHRQGRQLGAARAASRASRCATARTSSTRARAAAPRTPGCRRTPRHDLPRRRSLLLVRPLPRARREHRAPAAGHARARVRRRAAAAALLAAAGHRVGRRTREFAEQLRRRRRRRRRASCSAT